MRRNTPITMKVSAKLKIGKLYPNILTSIKSITAPLNILSIKLPIDPPITSDRAILFTFPSILSIRESEKF